ncbi:MAG TPA: YfiR family protein, partial [Bacillota bacterium]|nr:YfiR family protein [Bacillota bacterium]
MTGRRRHSGRPGWWPGLLLWLLLAGSLHAQNGPGLQEHEVQALYLYNFTKYIEWPAEAFATSDTPFTIGVFSKGPLLEDLTKVVAGKRVGSRALTVRLLKKREDLAQCHLVFIGAAEEANWTAWQSAAQGRALLTVGESDAFLSRGGVISFLRKEKRLGVCVNLEAAHQIRITISAKLLN